jgi:hypothetical protein
MDLIILNDGLYQLVPVTKTVMENISLLEPVNCMDLCEILRLKLTGYVDTLNLYIMNDGSGSLIGCMCR